MDLTSVKVLGKTTVAYIQARQAETVLQIGSDRFTRAHLAGLACYHFAAARILTRILALKIDAKDTADLYRRITPGDLALKGLGSIALAVLGAAFEAKRLGGDAPLEAWVRKHQDAAAPVHTFTTIKKHEHDREHPPKRRERAPRRRVTPARQWKVHL